MMRLILVLFFVLSFTAVCHAQTDAFNGPFDEQSPYMSPDGSVLYFTMSGHPSNYAGKKDPGDIWVSVRVKDGWSRPQPLIALNNASYNAVIGISSDGQTLYLYGHYGADGSPANTQGISVCSKNGAGWSRPDNIYIPYFINRSLNSGARLSADGKALVYAASAPTSYGAEDIYISLLNAEGWSEPIHLGSEVNSAYQEFSPSLSEDGKTLYFSTNRPGTKGSYDVYASERLDDSWRNWSAAIPLNDQINTESRELYYSKSGNTVLVCSTRDSDGYGDIRIILTDPDEFPEVKPADQKQVAPEILTDVQPDDVSRPGRGLVRIQGLITSERSDSPIPAEITIKGGGIRKIKADENGTFSFEVSKEDLLVLEADYKGFISKSQRIDLSLAKKQLLEVRMKLQPAEVGAVVTLSNVLFYQSSASLLPESYDELDVVANFLKVNPDIRIELSGHTDNRGDKNLNLRLSNERVKKVRNYLVGKGVDRSRIIGKGYGGAKPIADNKTEEGRRLNRRVEFQIIK